MTERQLRKCKDCNSCYDATFEFNKRKVYRCSASGHPHYRVGLNSRCSETSMYKRYEEEKQVVND